MMAVQVLQRRCFVIQRSRRICHVRFATRGTYPIIRRNFSVVKLKNAPIDTHIAEEDLVHLQRMSLRIMEDPICEFPKERIEQFVDRGKIRQPAILERVICALGTQTQAATNLQQLIHNRIENRELQEDFAITESFNHQIYFMMIHLWLLHQRLILEGRDAQKLEAEIFELGWTHVKELLLRKKIPEYRFNAELRNVQEYMFGCCVALDKALERPDILPARLQQVLWGNVYNGDVPKDADFVEHLGKYVLMQLSFLLQLEREVVLSGAFMWADFPRRPKKPKKKGGS